MLLYKKFLIKCFYGDIAQLVRVLASHARGRGFEPLYLHQIILLQSHKQGDYL